MQQLKYQVKTFHNVRYIEEGSGQPIIFLYGLFGSLKNFESQVDFFKDKYRVIVPDLPLLELNMLKTNLNGVVDIVIDFIKDRNISNFHLLGNSLGGHIALKYALEFPENLKSLSLTGSSGLFESGMGDSYPKRGDYNYIKEKVEYTFYNPEVSNKELVDEVFEIVTDRVKCLKIINLARSAIKSNMADQLYKLTMPTMIIWGNNDKITPPDVAYEFKKLLVNSEVHFIDECGHAPMMERPEQFNALLNKFLNRIDS
ncbi:MAG: alpha/beta fold hydrolase [Sediminibacterium sp.]|nr:alpha/beta fold hydrolase [Sediminibacterium sp.]